MNIIHTNERDALDCAHALTRAQRSFTIARNDIGEYLIVTAD